MSSARKLFVAALSLAACSGTSETRPKPDPTPLPVVVDAGVGNLDPVVSFDPSAAHLDDGPKTATGAKEPVRRTTRPIELVLRSTPNGARVYVDGVDRGVTPVLWQGETGEHIFAFVKKNHAMAQYRFWAITNGIVHARLEPVGEEIKPGAAPPPRLVGPPVPAPPTLVSPDAPVMAAPIDAAVPPAPAIDAAAPVRAIDAAPSGSPVGPTP